MVTKTERVRAYLRDGEFVKALAIASGFRLGMTTDDRRTMAIARDCLNGLSSFYRQIGIDTDKVVDDCVRLLNKKFG